MDKKASELIGLPVVTFNRGTKIYDVEDMILDPQRRQVLALVVENKTMFHSAKALPFGRIQAIGPNAIIIADGKAIIDVDRDPVLRSLDNKQVVIGLRVLTDDGRKLGEVSDLLIDDKTGEIKGYYVSIGKVLSVTQGTRWLPTDRVLSMGQRIMYVPADVAKEFDEQLGGWSGALDQAGSRVRTAGAKLNEQLEQLGGQVRQTLPQRADSMIAGKTAHGTITAPDGTVIVQEGEVITQEHVAAAREANRLPQVFMAAGAGPAQQNLNSLGEKANSSLSDIRTEAKELWEQLTGRYTSIVDDADSKAMQRRIKYALGRPASRVILDPEDNIILNTGDIITNRAVQAARDAGVLDILVESVYVERPKLSLDDLKAPRSGDASLKNNGGDTGGSQARAAERSIADEAAGPAVAPGGTATNS
ncbi:MAG TPA: PRC-barrel domain-containing protein [Chloroflexia bacterium]|jgi:uncharacterized protein YrrD